MKIVSESKCLTSTKLDSLINRVDEYVKKGWEKSESMKKDALRFYQRMVKYEEEVK